ncbi:dedicator of cytokinesis protein 1 isoform X3 [Thrips palmi]|uniref:Dedicator of cytokinesis protein 1 isoform X3 n=1 Tax=Thrips palmi TaxID=161013 RepID=A0A6P8YTK2_THRPL|nr:dedicator of cytokinesis protein 1 isoform X3 [Thrips palmi]
MTKWKPVREKDRYGIAIHNFNQQLPYRISLTVGESVHLLEQNGDWYFGCSTKNRAIRGIFPKAYIHVAESITDKSGMSEFPILKQPQVVQEMTSVLKEWGTIWKWLYVTHSDQFKSMERRILDLIRCRSKILSGTLPVDELRQMKKQVTSMIDVGNKILNLDMVVRDDQGNILNPEVTSTLELFHHHELATDRIRKATCGSLKKTSKVVSHYSYTLFVSLRNFVCKISEDTELLMALYDAKEGRVFTENYVVRWNKDSFTKDPDQLHNLRVLFTDLGSRDLQREKVYLVVNVVRLGAMDSRETEQKNRKSIASSVVGDAIVLRRPYGVAAIDITLFLSGRIETDEETHHFIPLLQCGDRDDLEGTLKRILTLKELTQREHKGHGLSASLKLLRGDLKQAREENPHLVLGSVAIARKMGFPEVILPGDVRNDLYLTLQSGEFSKGSKSTDKNVEVTVCVCKENGQVLEEVILMGGGLPLQTEYHSVIYYHEDKPRWNETFKVAIPIDDFKSSHLLFTFKHRSSNEAKDRAEKPFALSYVPLMQKNGTTLHDTQHELLVYKIDHKKYDDSNLAHLKLPATRSELADGVKPSLSGLSLSSKDCFIINTNVCSTKLTQNVDLLGLLKWSSKPEALKDSLLALMKVEGEEVVKFLQDVLDALFDILMQNSDSDLYDNMVFECLLYIIGLVSDRKYQHFQPVLDLYIQESFCATLAYNKLLVVLRYHVENANSSDPRDKDLLLKTMKSSLQYCIRFVVRSRLLFSQMNEMKGQQQFEVSLQQFLRSLSAMMSHNTDHTLLAQGACLKYLPLCIPDILSVFNAKQLSSHLLELIASVPPGRLTKQKMMTIDDIVHSQLFKMPECRSILLPGFTIRIKELLESREEGRLGFDYRQKSKSVAKIAKVLGASKYKLHEHHGYAEEVELCVKILSDIMDLLFSADVGPTIHDVTEVMLTTLRTVIQTTIAMDRESPLVGNLVAVMLAIFRQMTAHHFELYISHFPTNTDLLDFLMEILLVFKDLVSRPVFPQDWSEMIMLQNSVILKALRFFSHTIRDHFFQPFEHQAWNNFFHCAIAFLTQPALQLDNFSCNKRARIVSRYRDMRRETGFEIRSMWFNLGQAKIQFVPGLVGPFLEMTLIPETELRKATIPIFFDMMQCEFYSSRHPGEGFSDTKRDSSHIKAHFSEFENEMIAKLDTLVEGGRGDEHYKELFHSSMMHLCQSHSTMRDQGMRFVTTVTRLMERLLEYRCVINDENKENRMSCTVNLLDFYSEINRKEMYIRYVNKLCDLHLDCDNFTEAAHTLRLHSQLLQWSDASLPPLLRSPRHAYCHTHRQLKEALYYDIIKFFDKGKMWEMALVVCKELERQYEEEVMDYTQLSELLRRRARFYDCIMKQVRPEPEYFRVAYYGKGFPAFLQNKVFVYRGKEYERLTDFCNRTLNQLPNAELMNKLTPPGEDITESMQQFVQINKVEPVMGERQQRLTGRPINDQILRYHRVNNVQKFRFSRPFQRRDPLLPSEDSDMNEFASLWLERTVLVTSYPLPGILRWFPVTSSETYEISPLRNAIETMEAANKSLQELVIAHHNEPNLPVNPLSMKLSGILDAAVMGGITNYEKAFFTVEYAAAHPEEAKQLANLKDLIASQVPLLEVGVQLHKQRAPISLGPFQQRLEQCFREMQSQVEAKHGKKTCDLKLDSPQWSSVRPSSSTSSGFGEDSFSNRVSEGSLTTPEPQNINNRMRGSLTRSQVATLKSLAFNFSGNLGSSGTLGRHYSHSSSNNRSTSSLSGSPSSNSVKFGRSASISTDMTDTPVYAEKENERDKEKDKESRKSEGKRSRLSRKAVRDSNTSIGGSGNILNNGNSQWYTTETTSPAHFSPSLSTSTIHSVGPVFELRQELTPQRPLRSEVEREKRLSLSRPSSGQFTPSVTPSIGGQSGSHSGTSSNRDSVGTTSEDDGAPPPLPLKVRDASLDTSLDRSIDVDAEADYCNLFGTPDHVKSVPSTPSLRAKALPPTPQEETPPAVPSFSASPVGPVAEGSGSAAAAPPAPPAPHPPVSEPPDPDDAAP